MATQKKRVRTLYRVSTKGQLEENDMPMQRNACLEYIGTKDDWELDKSKQYIEKGISGYKKSVEERDVIQEILQDAKKQEFDVLLVYMFDRIGRREYEIPLYMKTLDSLGIELWSVEEGRQKFDDHSDDLINFIRFWQSSGESKKTSIRVSEDHKQMVLAGQFRGGIPPYGYKLEKSGIMNKKNKELMKLVIDENESKIVEIIFNLVYEKGFGGNRIAKYLNENDIKSRTGRSWSANTINYLLRNPIYKGYMVTGKRKVNSDGSTKYKKPEEWILSKEKNEEICIISDNIWEKVQEIRTSRQPQKVKDKSIKTIQITKSPLLLVGLAKCGHCGSPLTTTYNTKEYKKRDGTIERRRSIKYRCSGKALKKTNCDGQTIYSQRKVEDTVLEEIDEFISKFKEENLEKEVKKVSKNLENNSKKELNIMKNNLNKSEKELEKLEEEVAKSLMGDSSFKPELLSSLIDKKQKDVEEIKNKIKDTEEKIKEEQESLTDLNQVKKYIPKWRDEFHKLDSERKKMLINTIIDLVTVKRDEIEVSFNLRIKDFVSGISG